MSIREDILSAVKKSRKKGITAAEIETSRPFAKNTYHGPVSGHLSHLHRNGEIVRLAEKREVFMNGKYRKFKIYVFPEYSNGRLTEEQGR